MSLPVDRILLLVWEGASFDLLAPFAETGVMPRLASFLADAALIRLKPTLPLSSASCWASLMTGSEPHCHGVLDEYYLDHRPEVGLSVDGPSLPMPTMVDVVSRRFPETPGVLVSDGVDARLSWQGKPADFDALCERVALIQTAMYRAVSEARRVDHQVEWKLLTARFESLGRLLHSSWDFLGLPNQAGGNRQWVGKTREAFRTLDRCLGELLSLAEDRGASVALVSPYGTAEFRERINVNSLLLRNDLLAWSGRLGATAHRLSRRFWKLRRRVRRPWDASQRGRQARGRPTAGGPCCRCSGRRRKHLPYTDGSRRWSTSTRRRDLKRESSARRRRKKKPQRGRLPHLKAQPTR